MVMSINPSSFRLNSGDVPRLGGTASIGGSIMNGCESLAGVQDWRVIESAKCEK
jgi:hypothetical protein